MSQELDIKQQVADAFNELLTIPANQLNLAIMLKQVELNAMKLQQQEEERRYSRPVVVRAYYEGAVKAEVVAGAEEGELDVILSEIKKGETEWSTLELDARYHSSLAKLVLSQAAVIIGDIWYITNNHSIENNLEKAAQYFKGELDKQATEVQEAE